MSFYTDSKTVTELTPKDFDSTDTWKLNNHKCSVVMFYAPWCGHCKNSKEMWNELGGIAEFFDVCALDCEKYGDHVGLIKEDAPGLIDGYPSIVFYSKGMPVKKFEGDRSVANVAKECMLACNL